MSVNCLKNVQVRNEHAIAGDFSYPNLWLTEDKISSPTMYRYADTFSVNLHARVDFAIDKQADISHGGDYLYNYQFQRAKNDLNRLIYGGVLDKLYEIEKEVYRGNQMGCMDKLHTLIEELSRV